MDKRDPSPNWEYADLPGSRAALLDRTTAWLSSLAAGEVDVPAFLRDTRPFHAMLFAGLTPRGRSAFAGHYRGESFAYLKTYRVGIRSNPHVGSEPEAVRGELRALDDLAAVGLSRLDALHAPGSNAAPTDRLTAAVAFACDWFSQFLLIHPYANGNGHAARAGLVAILHRYGYEPRRFSVDPRPFGTAYSRAVRDHQRGRPSALESMILRCVLGDPAELGTGSPGSSRRPGG